MRPVKREPIYFTCCLIAVLAVAEGWVAWRYLHGPQPEGRADRIVALQNELRSKQAEINHLIFMRDSEHRLAQSSAARLARAQAQSQLTARLPGAVSLDEEDLVEATEQAFAAPIRRDPRPTQTDAMLAEADLEDSDAPQNSAELTPSDIDPKHLVNMANIMTGHPVAELTRMKGQSLIRYKSTTLREDDPVWHILDAVNQAHALREIVLVGKDENDVKRLNKVSETIASSGIPSRLIHVKTGDADYRGLEGLLITLRNEGKNP